MKNPKIAIIGHASRLPQTSDTHFWADLLAGRDLMSRVAADRWAQENMEHPTRSHPGTAVTFAAGSLGDVSGFDAGFFHISPREAAAMDPQQRLLLEMSWEALAHAGLPPEQLRGQRCGVFIGLASTDYGYRLADDLAAVGPNTATGCTASIAANRLSYFYDLRGPSLVVDTACSSALVAFHQACQSLLRGESDLALTGAISLHLHPFGFMIFSKASMLSAGGRCHPFDAAADGYARSEGGGVFVLKDYDRARRDGDRILAVVAHTAINTDGHKSGLTVPSAEAQTQLLLEAYAAAGIDADAVHYMEAHGTGTAVGDPIEVEAIGRALGSARRAGHPLPLGSVKSNLGHLETASGIPGLLKAIHCLRQRQIPPSIGIQQLNPRLPLNEYGLEIVREVRALPASGPLIVGVNSFGFGGANAHVILESVEPQRPKRARWPRRQRRSENLPLLLSAATPAALRQVAQDFAEALQGVDDADYARIYAANFRRAALPERALFRASRSTDLQALLRAFAAGDDTGAVLGRGLEAPAKQGPVFVYSGNGCQWAGMGRALLAHPVFVDTLAEIDACFVPLAGYALRDELAGVLGADRYALTEYAQPALFALQVGITALLRSDGITPVAVTGHSVGEVAAAWACGSLNLADAVRVIYERSRLQGLSRGQGGMTAVASDADTVAVWLQEAGLTETVSIAAWNSPRGSTLVGSADDLEALEGRLRKQGVGYKRLAIDYPFHSQHMDFLQTELMATLAEIRPAPASVPFISAVTGEAIAGESLDADYWWQNIRAPVRFQQAAASALMLGNIFVELGGHPVLRGYLQDTLNAREQEGRVIPTLRRDEQAPQAVAQAAAALWVAGCPLPKATYFSRVPEWVDLPHYPWERERHWQEATAESAGTLSGFSVHPLLGHPLPQHPGEWEQTLDTRRMPFLADHRVGDGVVFAGAAYAEMFLAAARQHFPESAAWMLEDLEILAPLLLEDDVSKVLRLTLQAHGEAQIQARTLLDTQWTLHAKAHIRPAEAADLAVAEADYQNATLPRRAADFTANQHYTLTDAVGLHYGPVFRTVQLGWRTAEGVQAQLRLPAEAESSEFLLHPALLDGALQLFADWLAEKGASHQGWGFVPVRIERLTRFAEATGTLTATVRVLRQSPQSLLAELRLFNAQGQIVAGCEGVRLRRVRLRRSEAERLRFLENVLVPLPDALPDVRHTACTLPPEVLQSLLPASLLEIPAVARYVHECAPLLESLQQAYADESAGSGDASIPASAIWHTLLRDYPEFFPLILQVGRQGLAVTEMTPGQTPVDLCATAQHTLLHTITPALSTSFAALVLQLRNHLPDNRLLLCAEVSAGGAEALPALTAHLHPDLRCRLWHLQPTISEPSESQGWITQTLDATPVSGLDALWLRLDHPDRNQQWSMLEAAERALAENGILWIQGVEPEAWWVGNHSAESTPLDQQSCRHWLLQRGFTEISAPPAPSVLPGPYLLSLQKGATQRPAPAPRLARDAGPWLLLGTAASTDHPDWSMLQTALHAAGYASQVCRSDSAQGLLTYLTESATTDWAGILYVDLPSGQVQDHAATVLQQCVLLTALGKWAVRRDALPPLYLLTRGGIRATHAGLYPQNHPEDGLDAAALCGFARSLQNEWPELRLRIIDRGTLPLTSAQQDALLPFLRTDSAESESVLDPKGHYWVPRIQEISRPVAAAAVSPVLGHQLQFSAPGQLRHLQWAALTTPPTLDAHAVLVDVAYTGLNFRDVMYALGMLSDEALENGFSGPALGLEFAGQIRAVGGKVTRWQVGDRVLGFAPASFSSPLQTLESAITALPEGMDMASAATIPTVFLTAWYALHELARLQPGERVLIHGAAGGVGIAAIQIAQMLGAEIFATAGSPEKRDFLRLLGVPHVYDSRSLDFAGAILRDTHHVGVDVLLNSLSGEAIRRNLQVLRPFGRFLELGKRDFYENTGMGLRPFRNNLSYFGIDADQLLAGQPGLIERLFTEIMTHFADGDFFPLPLQRFPATRVVEAFRHMQQARQIGKVVVEMRPPFTPVAASAPEACQDVSTQLQLDPDGVYLITGGNSGFGWATAQRLAQRGARHLLLVSRSGTLAASAQSALSALRAQGVTMECWPGDVSDALQMTALFAHIQAKMGPLRGIIHAAAVIDDGLAENLSLEQMQRVLQPKITGAWQLHRLSRDLPLDFFVVYSSITTLLGNPGQAHYVAANTWMEALVRMRRSQGLPALAVLWGPIADVGYLTRHADTLDLLQQRLGGMALNAETALDLLEDWILADQNGLVVADFDARALRRFLPMAASPRFAALLEGLSDAEDETDRDLRSQLSTLPTAEAEALLVGLLRREVAQILRMAPEKITLEHNLSQLGLDSLMGVELALALEERLGVKLPAFLLSEGPTLTRLAQRLVQTLQKDTAHPSEMPDAVPAEAHLQHLATLHGVLPQSTEAQQLLQAGKNP